MVPIIVSADEIKEKLTGYDPRKSGLFHGVSVKIADNEFADKLKFVLDKNVILMSGGSASGKTEFISVYLRDFNGIVFDGTLPTVAGAEIKFKKILKAKKIPQIYAIFPANLKRAFTAFLNRDRRYGVEHFYRTHSSSRKTLLWIAGNYPKVEIKVFVSNYLKNDKMSFNQIGLANRAAVIEFLKKSQYTEVEITNIVKRNRFYEI